MIMATTLLSLRRLTSGPRKPILEEQKGITPLVSALAIRDTLAQVMLPLALKMISGNMTRLLINGRKRQTSVEDSGLVPLVLALAAKATSVPEPGAELTSGNMTRLLIYGR